MRSLLIIAFSLLAAFSAGAADYEKTRVTAMGPSQDKTVANALALAVGQVNGQAVVQKMDIRETEDRVYVGIFGNLVEIPGKEINRGYTQSFNQGVIRRFEVKSVEYLETEQQYRVSLEAEVQALGEYKNIGADRSQLVSIAIAPFRSVQNSYEGLNGTVPASAVVERVTDELSAVMAGSNRFRVLDRANLRSLLSEDFITRALGQRTGQQLKFEQKLSADLVIVGKLLQFDIASRDVESYGQGFENYEGEMVVDVRALETATGEVRFAKRFEEYLNHEQIKAELDRFDKNLFNPSQRSDKRRVQYAIESLLIERIGTAVIQAFYPDYQPAVVHGVLPEQQPDEPTHLSDSPGSSEKPWSWK